MATNKASLTESSGVTDDFHDRYWIDVESTKGIMVGTSLNGIGEKVAMIDYANSADSQEIVRLASGYLSSM